MKKIVIVQKIVEELQTYDYNITSKRFYSNSTITNDERRIIQSQKIRENDYNEYFCNPNGRLPHYRTENKIQIYKTHKIKMHKSHKNVDNSYIKHLPNN